MRTIDHVKQILSNHPETRDSDRKLILKVWQAEGLELTPEQRAKFMDCSSPETIRRIRQKLQEYNYYPASKQVNEQRFKKFKEARSNAVQAPDNFNEGYYG